MPRLSVIVPVYNGSAVLPRCLAALAASDLPRHEWELVVVDDGSTDRTAAVAAEWADVLIRLPGPPHGPAYARNRGVEAASAPIVAFVDADITVHPDTLRRLAENLERNPGIASVFGSYDDSPADPGFLSQYRNLLHHYHHQRNPGEAETFWAGCGAVRRSAFLAVGGFDPWHYRRPSIEDIELGHRLRLFNHRLLIDPGVQCTHLKRWDLWGMLKTDLFDRGVPWVRLLLQEGRLGTMRPLNLRLSEKINTVCVALFMLTTLVDLGLPGRWRLMPLTLLLPVMFSNIPLYAFFRRRRGLFFALGTVPFHLAYYLEAGCAVVIGWMVHHLVGEPGPNEVVQAHAELKIDRWPPVPESPGASPWRATRGAPLTDVASEPVAGPTPTRDIPR